MIKLILFVHQALSAGFNALINYFLHVTVYRRSTGSLSTDVDGCDADLIVLIRDYCQEGLTTTISVRIENRHIANKKVLSWEDTAYILTELSLTNDKPVGFHFKRQWYTMLGRPTQQHPHRLFAQTA